MCVVIFLIRSNTNLAGKFLSGCNPMQIISSLCVSVSLTFKKKKTGKSLESEHKWLPGPGGGRNRDWLLMKVDFLESVMVVVRIFWN